MSLNIAKHRNILVKILRDIFSDITVGPLLGFKGGTAAYLFFDLDRFSVDLDFDLLDKSKEEYVFERIKKILEGYGKVKEMEKKRCTLFYLLSYDNKDVDAQNVKIEVNLRDFGSKYSLRSYLGINMTVMVEDDMFAHKFVAMYERIEKTNRDIFDVYFFLKNDWPINKKIIESRTNLSFKEFLKKNIKSLEEKDNKNILAGIGELLDEKQKVWVKAKLISETIFMLRLALENEILEIQNYKGKEIPVKDWRKK